MTGGDPASGGGREPWTVLAECDGCSWDYQEHDYLEKRMDETDSRLAVASRQSALHSQITGHAVRYLGTGSDREGDA